MDMRLLAEQISAVCPIDGVSVGRVADKSTWRIDFANEATAQQRAAAAAVVAAFDANAAPDPVSSWDTISLRTAFSHENRIRALEGKAAVTLTQFKAAVRTQLGEVAAQR